MGLLTSRPAVFGMVAGPPQAEPPIEVRTALQTQLARLQGTERMLEESEIATAAVARRLSRSRETTRGFIQWVQQALAAVDAGRSASPLTSAERETTAAGTVVASSQEIAS
jgi:hypothetical protein